MNRCEIITVWVTEITQDEYGKGRHIIGAFSNPVDAQEYGRGQSAWGSDGDVREATAIRVFAQDGDLSGERVYLLGEELDVDLETQNRRETRRAELMAQLSAYDKEVLGITE